jgi:hypothetical protein
MEISFGEGQVKLTHEGRSEGAFFEVLLEQVEREREGRDSWRTGHVGTMQTV